MRVRPTARLAARLLPALAVLAAAGACDAGPTQPAASDLDLPAPSLDRATPATLVSGSGIFVNERAPARAFTVSVREEGDGVRGNVQLSIGTRVRIHVDVTCATLEGNRAYVGGVVRSSSGPGEWPDGTRVAVKVVDNGVDGHDPADVVSFLLGAPNDPGSDLDARVCAETGQALVDLGDGPFPFDFIGEFEVRGNLTVRNRS